MPTRTHHRDEDGKKRRFGLFRFTRRTAAVVVALFMVVAPAGASVIVQNFMEAEIAAADACFDKIAGGDHATSGGLGTFDGAATEARDDVTLLEEKIDLTGMRGDRVIYTDMVTYRNNCTTPISLSLGAAAVSGTWTGVSAEVYLSSIAAPDNVDPKVDTNNHWEDTYIDVNNGVVAVAGTSAVTVPAGGTLQGAFVVSTAHDFAAPAAGSEPILEWVAQAAIG